LGKLNNSKLPVLDFTGTISSFFFLINNVRILLIIERLPNRDTGTISWQVWSEVY